jgi:hypothetical protein
MSHHFTNIFLVETGNARRNIVSIASRDDVINGLDNFGMLSVTFETHIGGQVSPPDIDQIDAAARELRRSFL